MKTLTILLYRHGSHLRQQIDVPTEVNELESLVLCDLFENDPKCQEGKDYWKDLKKGLKEEDPILVEDSTKNLYDLIFSKVDTFYWAHNYGEVVFQLVWGLRNVTDVAPNSKKYAKKLSAIASYGCRSSIPLVYRAFTGRMCANDVVN